MHESARVSSLQRVLKSFRITILAHFAVKTAKRPCAALA
jgi:hypothetical protein